ncbi:transposase [Vibrio gigantis]
MAYCDDGQLRISNIIAKNAIHLFAMGQRAWLFVETPSSA